MEWIKGKPPGFGEDRVWIVAEIPSLFNPKLFSYNEFLREDEKDINAHNRLKDALENLYCKLYYKSTEESNENLDGKDGE
jgi:hypothetical protein